MKEDYEDIIKDALTWYDNIHDLLENLNSMIIDRNKKVNNLDDILLLMRKDLQEFKEDLTKGEIYE